MSCGEEGRGESVSQKAETAAGTVITPRGERGTRSAQQSAPRDQLRWSGVSDPRLPRTAERPVGVGPHNQGRRQRSRPRAGPARAGPLGPGHLPIQTRKWKQGTAAEAGECCAGCGLRKAAQAAWCWHGAQPRERRRRSRRKQGGMRGRDEPPAPRRMPGENHVVALRGEPPCSLRPTRPDNADHTAALRDHGRRRGPLPRPEQTSIMDHVAAGVSRALAFKPEAFYQQCQGIQVGRQSGRCSEG
jgi:hypothetical protein